VRLESAAGAMVIGFRRLQIDIRHRSTVPLVKRRLLNPQISLVAQPGAQCPRGTPLGAGFGWLKAASSSAQSQKWRGNNMVAPHALGHRGTCWGSVKKGLNKIVASWRGS
jgi:hypothetical protein